MEEFIEKYSKQFIVHQSIISRGEMSDADCFAERTNLVHEYRKFLFIDPGLPKELLPSKWNGNHAALYLANIIKSWLNQQAVSLKAYFRKTMIYAGKMKPMMPRTIHSSLSEKELQPAVNDDWPELFFQIPCNN